MLFNKHLRTWIYVGALALAPALTGFAGGLQVGDTLPPLSEQALEGELPETAGKVVILDFWASWCKPCREAMPYLETLHKAHADEGLVVLGISCDERAKDMQKFLERTPVTFPTLRDASQKLVALCNIKSMPSSLIIGRDGRVRFIHSGFFKGKSEAEFEEQVRTLLSEAAPAGATP